MSAIGKSVSGVSSGMVGGVHGCEGYAKHYDKDDVAKFDNKRNQKFSWFKDFKLLYNMVSDKKFSLSKRSYLTMTGALAYLVFPTDVMPDFIPGVGWIDDAFVLKIVVDSTKDEIDRYKSFIRKFA